MNAPSEKDDRTELLLIRYAERWRWRLLSVWIVLFSAGMIIALVSAYKTAEHRRQDRNDQIAALTQGQIKGCERGNERFKSLLNLAAQLSARARMKKDGDSYKKELLEVKKLMAPYYKTAHVKCKVVITQTTTTTKLPTPTSSNVIGTIIVGGDF